MTRNYSIWNIIRHNGNLTSHNKTLVAVICWNIWREKNIRIFNSIAHSLDICLRLIIHDFIFWTSILSDEERLQISGGISEEDINNRLTSPEQRFTLGIGSWVGVTNHAIFTLASYILDFIYFLFFQYCNLTQGPQTYLWPETCLCSIIFLLIERGGTLFA